MQEKYYSFVRHFSFWLFSLAFIILTPIIVYYSLGYKFDIKSKKFLKTGALSVKTLPRATNVYLDGKKMSELNPTIIRELMPRKYNLLLEKEGFYPYRIDVDIKPSLVNSIDVFLVPEIKGVEKIKFDFNIYKFFLMRQIFTEKILIFTDKGIYFLDTDFEGVRKVSGQVFEERLANSIEEVIANNNKLIFWNKKDIWVIEISSDNLSLEDPPKPVYTAKNSIKDAFLGLHEKYLIVNDGLKVVALDMDNLGVSFDIYTLNSFNSKMFYDARSETLYIRDKITQSDAYSLFKIKMMPLIEGRIPNERRKD